jgi:hypothetical protein
MKEWTKEEVERLVPDECRITVKQMMAPNAGDIFKAVADALLQTRLNLETAKEDAEQWRKLALLANTEIARLRGALERADTISRQYVSNDCAREIRRITGEALKEKP